MLSAELRKVETELSAERERLAAAKGGSGGGEEQKEKPAKKQPTAYDVQVKNFCECYDAVNVFMHIIDLFLHFLLGSLGPK